MHHIHCGLDAASITNETDHALNPEQNIEPCVSIDINRVAIEITVEVMYQSVGPLADKEEEMNWDQEHYRKLFSKESRNQSKSEQKGLPKESKGPEYDHELHECAHTTADEAEHLVDVQILLFALRNTIAT